MGTRVQDLVSVRPGTGSTTALLAVLALAALACTSSAPGPTSSGAGASSGGSTGAATGSASGRAAGASASGGTGDSGNMSGSSGTSGGTGTSGSSTGGSTGGGPCIPTGTTACQSMAGPPPDCWLNPQTSDQIMNGCTSNPYDQSIPAPPPDGGEDLPEYDGGTCPLPSPD